MTYVLLSPFITTVFFAVTNSILATLKMFTMMTIITKNAHMYISNRKYLPGNMEYSRSGVESAYDARVTMGNIRGRTTPVRRRPTRRPSSSSSILCRHAERVRRPRRDGQPLYTMRTSSRDHRCRLGCSGYAPLVGGVRLNHTVRYYRHTLDVLRSKRAV